MTERPNNSPIHDWLDETVGPTPDPVEGTRQVMSQVEETSQAGRWLPFSLFHRKARTSTTTPSTTDTAKFQPSPIPASNGHTPTAIGRTTSMFSPVKAITAGALVFAIGGAFLIAQPFQQQSSVPGAATDGEAAPNTEFTAEWGFTAGGCCIVVEPASDPRFAGAMSASIRHAYYPYPDFLLDVASRALHVRNEEGAWRGVPSVVVFHPDGTESTTTQTFIGDGAYAGLFAVADIESTPGAGGGVKLHGYIIEGEPPAIE